MSSSTETVSAGCLLSRSQRRTRVSFSRGHLRRRVVLGRFHCNVIVCSVFAGNNGSRVTIHRIGITASSGRATGSVGVITPASAASEASTSAPSVLEVALAASPLISSPLPASPVAASPFVASPLPASSPVAASPLASPLHSAASPLAALLVATTYTGRLTGWRQNSHGRQRRLHRSEASANGPGSGRSNCILISPIALISANGGSSSRRFKPK